MPRPAGRPARRIVLALPLAFALAFALASCGKKGPPEPPEGEEVTYPRTYPTR